MAERKEKSCVDDFEAIKRHLDDLFRRTSGQIAQRTICDTCHIKGLTECPVIGGCGGFGPAWDCG